jgi:hypothetical protein
MLCTDIIRLLVGIVQVNHMVLFKLMNHLEKSLN